MHKYWDAQITTPLIPGASYIRRGGGYTIKHISAPISNVNLGKIISPLFRCLCTRCVIIINSTQYNFCINIHVWFPLSYNVYSYMYAPLVKGRGLKNRGFFYFVNRLIPVVYLPFCLWIGIAQIKKKLLNVHAIIAKQ